MNNQWKLQDIVLIGFIAFLFGWIFMGAGVLHTILLAILTPRGFSPFAHEIVFGMWTMAAPVAGILIKKKGASILGELLSSFAEMLYGSFYGAGVIISGFLQGLGTELGFIFTKYKRFDTLPLIYGAIGTTIISFIHSFYKHGYWTYGLTIVVAMFIVRFLSVYFFNVILVKQIIKLYDKFLEAKTSY